ncbi:hypothetical protein ACSFXN_03120 [Planococcus sp. 1R117A]|uniref:hypothetical protein n=1 Tax=Planococcus sp. 1R117A TaxID=3447020 RepID=UPI003EDC8D7B
MFKKSLIAAFVAMMVIMMISTSAFASEKTIMTPEIAQAFTDVETVNAKIYSEVAKAQEKAERMYTKYLEDFANEDDVAKQAELTSKYNEKINKLIAKLDSKTQEITRKGAEKATAGGITVEVEWVLFQFGDRSALIDPLIVIGW